MGVDGSISIRRLTCLLVPPRAILAKEEDGKRGFGARLGDYTGKLYRYIRMQAVDPLMGKISK
jgi:hypothetical protein